MTSGEQPLLPMSVSPAQNGVQQERVPPWLPRWIVLSLGSAIGLALATERTLSGSAIIHFGVELVIFAVVWRLFLLPGVWPVFYVWFVLSLLGAMAAAEAAQHDMVVFVVSFLLLSFGLGLPMVIVMAIGDAARDGASRKAYVDQQRAMALQQALLNPLSPILSTGLVTKPGETCYWRSDATMLTMHHHREYEGGYGGTSIRVMKGVSIRSGSSRGTSVDHPSLDSDGLGTLYLTTQRFVFVGQMTTMEIELAHVASVIGLHDGVRINVLNKPPVLFETGDSRLHLIYVRMVNGMIGAISTAQAEELRIQFADDTRRSR